MIQAGENVKKEKKKVILEAGMAVMLFLLVVIGGRVCLKAADGSRLATGSQAEQSTKETKAQKQSEQDGNAAIQPKDGKAKKDSEEAETAANVQEGYPILGTSAVTAKELANYFKTANLPYPSEVLGKGGAEDIETFAQIYCEQAKAEGVRPEVAFVQTMKETAWLQYGGDAKIEQYNFAGIGTTGNGVQGDSFPDVRTGIRAQIQHLKAYATEEPLNQDCVDTRYQYVIKGSAPYVEWLGKQENPQGQGWATAEKYGDSIVEMIQNLPKP